MEIRYHGHSCVQLSHEGHSLIIDPFISGNPLAATNPEDIKVEHILLTHAHPDHILDTVPIAKNNDATVVATFELATYMSWQGAKTFAMNIGGRTSLGYAEIEMIQAFHSSGIVLEEEKKIIYGGMPGGFIIRWNGLTLLHSGDTSLFSDMKLIGERNQIDVAFLPIGDVFTMGPQDAALAAEWLKAKTVVPLHFNTFPPIRQNAQAFADSLTSKGITGKALRPGEVWTLS
ncbi:metal-dependent hydrolase [Paenibacillus naphthalenovorans]|uniref:metal-dependent hydrolase n=1 Tax=Paenibacillus naphthalenovorans TaxID=162209 RepID=UPI003D2A2D7C